MLVSNQQAIAARDPQVEHMLDCLGGFQTWPCP